MLSFGEDLCSQNDALSQSVHITDVAAGMCSRLPLKAESLPFPDSSSSLARASSYEIRFKDDLKPLFSEQIFSSVFARI